MEIAHLINSPQLRLCVPQNAFARPEDKDLHPQVKELLEKASEIARDTGRAYLDLCHLGLAILITGSEQFNRPKNIQTPFKRYLSDVLKEGGQSIDTLQRFLWKNAVRLPIQEGYSSDEIYESIDLIDFLRNSCRWNHFHGSSGESYLNYILRKLFRHESLSNMMKDYPISVKEIEEGLVRLQTSGLTISSLCVDDLTKNEEEQESPTIGRCDVIKQMIRVMSCMTRNIPLLVGKSGVGKTTIGRILAQRVLTGRVPQHLCCRVVKPLDREHFYLLLNSLKSALSDDNKVILFVDDVHTVYETDFRKLLDFVRDSEGHLYCIGTTTPNRYEDVIKKAGSSKYFFDIQIAEPSISESVSILRTLTPKIIEYHGGEFDVEDAALCQAVNLAKRFFSSTVTLPRSAIQILDQACALVRTQGSQAYELWECSINRKVTLEIEIAALKRQRDSADLPRFSEASTELMSVEDECSTLRKTFEIENGISEKLQLLYEAADEARDRGDKFTELDIRLGAIPDLQDRCDNIDKNSRMNVTVDVVARAVSDATGFPVEKLTSTKNEKKVLALDVVLAEHVIGQAEATKAVANAIQLAYSGLNDPDRPIASFLLVGPSGTGKILLAKILAKTLFDSPEAMIRIDASEYSERHSVARLIGSPPGYEGNLEGGQLTNYVRENPYTIVLIDEIEKAALEFNMLFLQVLDDGRLTDGQGDVVDFRHTVIIMTSNLGSEHMATACSFEEVVPPSVRQLVTRSIQAHFPPEFINRIDEIIFYRPLSRANIRSIVETRLKGYSDRLKLRRISLHLTDWAKDHLSEIGYSPVYGARPLARVMREQILNPLAKMLLKGDVKEGENIAVNFNAESQALILESSGTYTAPNLNLPTEAQWKRKQGEMGTEVDRVTKKRQKS